MILQQLTVDVIVTVDAIVTVTADVDLDLATIAVSGLLFFLYAVAALAMDAVDADVAVTTAVSGLSCF